jgi:hypothetical protein
LFGFTPRNGLDRSMFINLFTLLKKVENNLLGLFSGSVTTKSQFISESSWLNKVSENDE